MFCLLLCVLCFPTLKIGDMDLVGTLSQRSMGPNDKNYARKDLNDLSSSNVLHSVSIIVMYKMKDLFSFNNHVKPGVRLASCVKYKPILCGEDRREAESGDNTLKVVTSHVFPHSKNH